MKTVERPTAAAVRDAIIGPVEETRKETVEYGLRRWIIVMGVVLAPLLETIDSSIVNVALPDLRGNLGANLDEATWVVTAYLVANVVVIPLTPWLQLRFGRRQYLTATIVGFTLTSMACGFSTSIEELIVLRLIQGAFGGGLIATAQAALRDIFPLSEVGTSQGVFAVVILIGPIVAPVLGGWIVDAASWPWIFYINVLPGVVSAIIVGTMLRNPYEPRSAPVDVAGIALLTAAIGGLQYLLDEGERHDWLADDGIRFAAALALIGGIAFVLWELYGTRRPIVDLRVLRYRSVAVGVLLAAGIAASLFGTIFVLPQYTQDILGLTALGSGLLLLFRAVPVMLLAPVVAGLVGSGRIDARLVMACGYTFTAVGSWLIAAVTTSDTSFGHVIPGLVVGGFGTAMLFIPLLITVQTATNADDAPQAASFITLAFQLGGSVASAILVTILDRRSVFHLDAIASTLTGARAAVRSALGTVAPATLASLAQKEAETMAFADVAYLVAAIAIALVPLVLLMRRQPRTMTEISFE